MNTRNEEEVLQKKADLVRQRLLDVVDELDRRRHALQHPLRSVKKRVPSMKEIEPVWFAAGGAAAVCALSLWGARVAKRRRTRRKVIRVTRGYPPPSFGADVANRAGRALLSFALIQLGKQAWNRASLSPREGRGRGEGQSV